MDEQTTALARELVRAPGFRWMAGMRTADEYGELRLLSAFTGADESCDVRAFYQTKPDGVPGPIPDLDDPGTEGCLQRLLDESGCEYGTGPVFGSDGRMYCVGPSRSYKTRGQALARALLAIADDNATETGEDSQ